MTDDAALVARLRAGDESAFGELVRAQNGRLLRLVRGFCRGNRATAEEVVQDVWVAVLTGLDRYTGEAPLGAWMAGIAVNKARSRTTRDGRMVLFSDLARAEMDGESGSGLDPDRFRADGHWGDPVTDWDEGTPERLAGNREMLRLLAVALDTLPPAQRTVVTLRDIEGHDGGEVCRILGLTDGNMRVLLHRGRNQVARRHWKRPCDRHVQQKRRTPHRARAASSRLAAAPDTNGPDDRPADSEAVRHAEGVPPARRRERGPPRVRRADSTPSA